MMASLADLLHRPAWMTDALCRENTDINFVDARTTHARARAFDTCGQCSVRDACLEWATFEVRDFNRHVVLGGMDGPARRRLAKQRHAEAQP